MREVRINFDRSINDRRVQSLVSAIVERLLRPNFRLGDEPNGKKLTSLFTDLWSQSVF